MIEIILIVLMFIAGVVLLFFGLECLSKKDMKTAFIIAMINIILIAGGSLWLSLSASNLTVKNESYYLIYEVKNEEFGSKRQMAMTADGEYDITSAFGSYYDPDKHVLRIKRWNRWSHGMYWAARDDVDHFITFKSSLDENVLKELEK
tara:strand:+ start:263 stop:706 length:444 start_codon:yes stop_codon:yes gene_type:complete